jgi:hypothetical protein
MKIGHAFEVSIVEVESSWIMAEGQMEGIHLFFIIFPDSLAINNTTLELPPPTKRWLEK